MVRGPRPVEDVVISSAFWRGRRVFLTGHTGFKGAWLSLMLERLCADVTGFALAPPTEPNLFDLAGVAAGLRDIRGDVADAEALARALAAAEPEIVIHMAAQPLVRQSYADPVETYRTNVMGTVHLLDAVRHQPSVRTVLIVTTDKCYENREWARAYRESDALGGHDPYSSSKACAEIAAAAFGRSFLNGRAVRVVTARAGNVIGGGDFAADRILPDAMRAAIAGRSLHVRNPRAVRPWQHVLDPLLGYLLLAEAATDRRDGIEGAFNFGPGPAGERNVGELLATWADAWGNGAAWTADTRPQPHEATLLRLDTSRARHVLGWTPQVLFEDAVVSSAQWYRAYGDGRDLREMTFGQIDPVMGRVVRLVSPFAQSETRAEEDQRRAG